MPTIQSTGSFILSFQHLGLFDSTQFYDSIGFSLSSPPVLFELKASQEKVSEGCSHLFPVRRFILRALEACNPDSLPILIYICLNTRPGLWTMHQHRRPHGFHMTTIPPSRPEIILQESTPYPVFSSEPTLIKRAPAPAGDGSSSETCSSGSGSCEKYQSSTKTATLPVVLGAVYVGSLLCAFLINPRG